MQTVVLDADISTYIAILDTVLPCYMTWAAGPREGQMTPDVLDDVAGFLLLHIAIPRVRLLGLG